MNSYGLFSMKYNESIVKMFIMSINTMDSKNWERFTRNQRRL